MAAAAKVDGSSTRRTANRGEFTVNLKELANLEPNTILEALPVEIAGFRWQTAVFRCFRSQSSDTIHIHLFNCNAMDISADIEFEAYKTGKEVIEFDPGNGERLACSFHSIYQKVISFDKLECLAEAPLDDPTLTVTFDLMDVKFASDCQALRKLKSEMYTINLEILNDKSISRKVSRNKESQIVSSSPHRSSSVCSGSLVRLWTHQHPDYRYWLCKRRPDGHVIVECCLNEEARLFERFEQIDVKHDGESSWVTVFEETKESGESFTLVDSDTMLVFCEIWSPKCKDMTYLGHLLVQKTMLFYKFCTKITDEFRYLDGKDFIIRLENSTSNGRVTATKSTLEKCGVRSGSIFVIEESSAIQGLSPGSPVNQQIQSQRISNDSGDGLDILNDSGNVADPCSASNLGHGILPKSVQQVETTAEAVTEDPSQNTSLSDTGTDSITPVGQHKDSSSDVECGDDLHNRNIETLTPSEFLSPKSVHKDEKKFIDEGEDGDPGIVKKRESDGDGAAKEPLLTVKTESAEVTKKELGPSPDGHREQRYSKSKGMFQTRSQSFPAENRHDRNEVSIASAVQFNMQPSHCKLDKYCSGHSGQLPSPVTM